MVEKTSISRTCLLLLAGLVLTSSGCVSKYALPVKKLPPPLQAIPRADKEPIDFSRLGQEPPANYILGPRDILGVYVEGVLGKSDEAPPVHFSTDSKLPPALGFPIPVGDDGTVELPLIPPVKVAGLTVSQASQLIRHKYNTEFEILQPGKDRTIVTLLRKRAYQVLVIREDEGSGAAVSVGSTGPVKRGSARAVDLAAYENDVLHALSETGGLPGLDAKNEVVIIRRGFADDQQRSAMLRRLEASETGDVPIPSVDGYSDAMGIGMSGRNVTRIPLRIGPNDPPVNFNERDIILSTGDIVFIESRERDVFYTGGLLPGREIPLPRDFDLDVMGAISLAGGSIGSSPGTGHSSGGIGGGSGGGGGLNVRGLIPPTQVIIVRKINGNQVAIKASTRRALLSASERILIKPGDLVMLEYTAGEMAANIALNLVSFNFLVNSGSLFGNNNNN